MSELEQSLVALIRQVPEASRERLRILLSRTEVPPGRVARDLGVARIDDLVFAITPDATARYAKLKAGECHVNGYPRPADLPEMQKDASLKVINMSGLNVAYWAFNAQKPPFDKKEVRLALAEAIDRDAILKDVYLGAGEKASTLVPRTMWAYNDKVEQIPFDPEKSKQLLAAAGVKTPLDIDLWYMPVARPYNPNGKRIGEMMQADLAKI